MCIDGNGFFKGDSEAKNEEGFIMADNIRINFHRIYRTTTSVHYYSPLFYNKIPNQMKEVSERIFIFRLTEHHAKRSYCSIDEFLNTDEFSSS